MSAVIPIPWLHDQHNHASFYAALIGCPTLAGLNHDDVVQTLGELPEDRLSVAFGWHSAKAPLSERDLESLPPAIIVNLSMHGFALTRQAIPILADTQPEMVAHWQEPEWCEVNLPHLLEIFGQTAQLTAEKLSLFMARMEGLGLGSVDDMLLPDEPTFQVIQGSRWAEDILCWATPRTFKALSASSRKALAGLKFFTDGALGSRTAGLKGTFLEGRKGLLLYQDEALMRILGESHAFDKPVAIHAIGDQAIEQVLGALERLDRDGLSFPLARLEHVQFIDERQAHRAKALGLVLSMQPNFNSDSRDYADRLDTSWLERNNPFRMLIDRAGFVPGKDLIFGSDGMPHGVEYALQWSLFPAYPGQRLTVDELVAGYGIHSRNPGRSLVEIDPENRKVKLLESRADR